MKRRDLEKLLKASGWVLFRHGSDHDIWTNGTELEAVPRHKEINERLAQAIIKRHRLTTRRNSQ